MEYHSFLYRVATVTLWSHPPPALSIADATPCPASRDGSPVSRQFPLPLKGRCAAITAGARGGSGGQGNVR
jgi:hypothetical protein